MSLTAGRGELVAVIGPNGAGKTTLLSILAGIQRPDEGDVSVEPERVGWVPQQPALYGKLTVAENLQLFARLERVPDPSATVDRMLELTDLRERADDQVGTLSGGNRQRVNIAIGLLAEPEVLLLDEPSTGARPAPARAPVGVHPAPGRRGHDRRLRDPPHPGGRPLRQPADRAGRRRARLRRLAARARAGHAGRPGSTSSAAFVEYLHQRGH